MSIKQLLISRHVGGFLKRTIDALAEWRSIKKLSQHMGADRITKHDRKALKTYLKSTTVGRVL
jgi:hypothetical protein